LGRDKRADFDLTHAGGVLGVEPGELLFGRQDLGDALQAVAEPDFADMGTLAHSLLPAGILRPKARPATPHEQRSQRQIRNETSVFIHLRPMPGLDPGIHEAARQAAKWIAGSSPAMTALTA